MKMVVLDGHTLNPGDLSWDPLKEIGELEIFDRTALADIVERARPAEILLTNKVPLSRETLNQLPALKFIAVTATGYDMVDVAAAGQRGIAVANVPEYGTDSVAQFVFALLLALCHRVEAHDRAVKAGQWQKSPDWCFWNTLQVLLSGKKMGIVGFGRIGRRVGGLAHAFGMEVLAFDPVGQTPPGFPNFNYTSIEELFSQADVVTLHCLMNDRNKGFVDRSLIGLMKKSAFFINASRGGLVNEQDLVEALNSGRIAGAAVDVVSAEPVRPENPLLHAKNCLITPHIAWATSAARQNLMNTTVANIKAFLAGRPVNVVNPAGSPTEPMPCRAPG
jgi:glycerate dehydrogenase